MSTNVATTASTIASAQAIQEQLNSALKDSGLSPTAINNLMTTVTNSITCDDECQRRKNADALKLKYEAAKANVKEAPFELTNAEKNYYEYIEYKKTYLVYETGRPLPARI